MKNYLTLILPLILIITLSPINVFGESTDEGTDDESLSAFWDAYFEQEEISEQNTIKNYSGWKGIAFTCYYDMSDETLKQISQRAISDIKMFATANKVNLETFDNMFYGIARSSDYIPLSYYLKATQIIKNGYEFKAIYGHLTFDTYLSRAVEIDAKSSEIGSIPRTGLLVIWDKELIHIGSPSDIVTPFSDEVEKYIEEALTTYSKYAK